MPKPKDSPAADAGAVRVSEFRMDDYDAVYRLWHRGDLWMRPSDARDAVELKLTRDPDLFLVASVDERIVGVTMGGWDGRRAYVYHLAVDPDWQRRGVATLLMDELEERFRAKGALKAKLQIMVHNEVSRGFFSARGYELETDCAPWGKELVEGGAPNDWMSC